MGEKKRGSIRGELSFLKISNVSGNSSFLRTIRLFTTPTTQNKKIFSLSRPLLPPVLLMYDTSALTNHRAEHVLRRIAGVSPTVTATLYSTHTTVNERDLLPSTQISCAIQGGKEKARFRSALPRSHGGAPFMSTLAHTELASLGTAAAIDRKTGGRNRPVFGLTTRGRAILLLPDPNACEALLLSLDP